MNVQSAYQALTARVFATENLSRPKCPRCDSMLLIAEGIPCSTPAAGSTMTGRATIAAMNSAPRSGCGGVRNGIIKAAQALLLVA